MIEIINFLEAKIYLENSMCGSRDGDNSLRTGTITDVDLCSTLLTNGMDDLSSFANDWTNLLAGCQASQGQVNTGNVTGKFEVWIAHDDVDPWMTGVRKIGSDQGRTGQVLDLDL